MKLSLFLNWLDTFLNFEKTQKKGIFWLDSMKFLCNKLGNPQNQIPCIHVAGSKGKGSTSKMISCIIEAQGYSCGLYTSPHINDFRERIGTANGFFEDKIYEDSADELYACVNSFSISDLPGERQFTWFELVTAFSFLCFKNANVDYVVYETGLGGRLDSTNVILPLVSVITTIELEHTEFLGDTVEKIAAEKAGIIKQGIPIVQGKQKYLEAEEVFRRSALNNKSMYINVYGITKVLTEKIVTEDYFMPIEFKCNVFDSPIKTKLKLIGEVQLWNAITASVAVKTAIPFITEKSIEIGLSNAFLPGRFEIKKIPEPFNKIKGFILDGAHTVNSILFTLNTLKEVYSNKNNKFDLLFACAADKDIKDIAPLFKNIFENITITRPGTVRASDISSVEHYFSDNNISFEADLDCEKAIEKALVKANKFENILLVTGSFYLIAEVDKYLAKL